MNKYKFIGDCAHIRKTVKGESFWRNMYTNRKRISESEFLKYCDVSGLLDDGESWQQWVECAYDSKYYKFRGGAFILTHGFEFIFGNERGNDESDSSLA